MSVLSPLASRSRRGSSVINSFQMPLLLLFEKSCCLAHEKLSLLCKNAWFYLFITVGCVLTVKTFFFFFFFSSRLQLLTIFNFSALAQPLFE